MRHVAALLALLALAGAAIWYSLNPKYEIRRGLDLQGGMRVTLEPNRAQMTPDQVGLVNAETMETVRDVLENRVNSFGLSGAEVRLKGNDQIVVSLPGAKNPEEALRNLTTVAQLEFRHLTNVQSRRNPGARYRMDFSPGNPATGQPDNYTFTDTATNQPVEQAEVIQQSQLLMRGDQLEAKSRAQISPATGEPEVTFEFKPEGGRIFGEFTTNNVGEILAIVLDNQIISAPNINEPITGGSGQISGGFANMAEARLLANLLNSGALPIPMAAAETQQIGATLGQESVNSSIRAGLAGLGLVLLFMLAYYWLPGLLACLALIIYAAINFSIFKGFPFLGIEPIVLDLPGITGFILSVGMAVDANILIFERLKEELRAGKSMQAAVDAGFRRAFSSILDANVTTWIVCAILIWLGAPIIKGFAITLAIGVAVSMFTAITVTRTLLYAVQSMAWARNPALYGLGVSWLGLFFPAARRGVPLRVYDKRKIYFGLSILMGVLALVFTLMTFAGKGLQPGIDFTGGTTVEAAFQQPGVTREQVESAVRAAGVQDATVSIAQSEVPFTNVTVKATGADLTTENRIREALANLDQSFDADAFQYQTEGQGITVTARYAGAVPEAEIRSAVQRLGLTSPQVTVNVVPHEGTNALQVALISSRDLKSNQETLAKLRTELDKLGGGLVAPMYQVNSVGPSVAREITLNAFSSVLVASLAIMLYLAFRFAIGGFMTGLKFATAAIVALVHDVGIVVGVFALMGWLADWRVDSLFVTAALAILGFSINDTIVVYDRVRENLVHRARGETFADVSDKAITETFDRSINTNLTVIMVIAAMVFFGGESIRLFNIALLIGMLVGSYSSIFLAAPMVVLLERATAGRAAEGTPTPTRTRRETPAAAGTPAAPRREAQPGRGVATTERPTRPTASAADLEEPADGGEHPETERGGRPGQVKPRRKRRL
ncbi:MAG: protein translocase subunit SecD [Armatimonadota bacterium]